MVVSTCSNAINEAKVEQMDPVAAYADYVYKTMFNGHQYQWMPKGDWRDIVTLTRAKMKDYYNQYYHPSNGQAFCYGPQDFVDECMNLMDPYLSKYNANDHIRKASEVQWVTLTEIKSIEDSVPYPSYQDTTDFRLGLSYVLNDQTMDERTKMAWYIIEDLLLGSPAAVIPQTITDLNLGDDVIGGLQSHLQQWVLTLGVSGVPSSDQVGVARIRLQQKIIDAATNGFDPTAVKATLNKLYVRFREQSSYGIPRGVSMFKDALTTWNYDDDPRIPLSYANPFAEVKKELETNGQGLLLQLITLSMVDNNHLLTAELYPSTSLLTLYKNVSEIDIISGSETSL